MTPPLGLWQSDRRGMVATEGIIHNTILSNMRMVKNNLWFDCGFALPRTIESYADRTPFVMELPTSRLPFTGVASPSSQSHAPHCASTSTSSSARGATLNPSCSGLVLNMSASASRDCARSSSSRGSIASCSCFEPEPASALLTVLVSMSAQLSPPADGFFFLDLFLPHTQVSSHPLTLFLPWPVPPSLGKRINVKVCFV
jgi:hypothetical protein